MRMRTWYQRVCRHLRGLPMRWKMTLSFAVPVILISLLAYLGTGYYMQRRTEAQLQRNTEQALMQAGSFINSYLQNMEYITEQIGSNQELIKVLSASPEGAQSRRESYQEYYALNRIFQQIELSSEEYRIGMYVPDSKLYSSNDFYFYPESSLEEMDFYEEVQEAFTTGRSSYQILRDKRTGDPASRQEYLARLSQVTFTDENGNAGTYVVKVEVRLALLRQILDNALPTEGSCILLADPTDQIQCVSSETAEYQSHVRLSDIQKTRNWDKLRIANTSCYTVRYDSNMKNWALAAAIPVQEYYLQFFWLLLAILLLMLLTVLVVMMVSYVLARYYTSRISFLNRRMTDVQQGNINLQISGESEADGQDEMAELYSNFDFMIEEIQKLMKEQYRLGRSISRTEMKALQAQINPHFLYNTLDLINWGAMDYGADEVARIARNLGLFYRLSLNHGNSVISIRDELRHVKAFVDIENAHYENAISLYENVPEDLLELACLNITLQPFVENAILHGMGEHEEITGCRLDIGGRREGEDVILWVQDDGPGMSKETARRLEQQRPEDHGKGFGIMNVNFRIKLAYGEQYGVTYRTNNGSGDEELPTRGTLVQIRIRACSLEELEKIIQM